MFDQLSQGRRAFMKGKSMAGGVPLRLTVYSLPEIWWAMVRKSLQNKKEISSLGQKMSMLKKLTQPFLSEFNLCWYSAGGRCSLIS